jgi:hypothetical protein
MRPRFLYPALVLMVAALGALLALRLVPEPEHPAVWVAVLVGPAFGLSATPLLVTLAGLLTALLLVEGVVALAALPRT